MNLQEVSGVEDDNKSSTKASSDKDRNESSYIECAAEPLPGSGRIEEHVVVAEAMTGQARANEVLRQCHKAGREIDGYEGGYITTYPVSEFVLLRFVEMMDEDDNEIFEGPYTVVDHYGNNGRRKIKNRASLHRAPISGGR